MRVLTTLLLVLSSIGCASEPSTAASARVTRAAMVRVDIEGDELVGAELLGVVDADPTRLLPFEPGGALGLRWLDGETGVVMAESQLADPRWVYAERETDDGGLRGGLTLQRDTSLVVVLPVTDERTAILELQLHTADGVRSATHTLALPDDGTPGDVGRATEALGFGPDPTHVAGSVDPRGKLLIGFVPHGFDDMEEFERRALSQAQVLLRSPWFAERAGLLSLYALRADVVNAIPDGTCLPHDRGHAFLTLEPAARIAVAAERYGPARATPDIVVILRAQNPGCENFARRGIAVLYGEPADHVFPHEIGHALAWLADEYVDPGHCRGDEGPNVAIEPGTPWDCIRAGAPFETECPAGGAVHAHSRVCESEVRPCRTCVMRANGRDFCPVCSATMEARLQQAIGSTLSESCNGADDDVDGETDEGCDCALSCSPAGAECTRDGDCCSDGPTPGICEVGRCTGDDGCKRTGQSCRDTSDCCAGRVDGITGSVTCGAVFNPSDLRCCLQPGSQCSRDSDCCGETRCIDGTCGATCSEIGGPCSGSGSALDGECCGDAICVVGACQPAAGGRERTPCASEACAVGLACMPVGGAAAAPTCCARGGDPCRGSDDCCGLMTCEEGHCRARRVGESCLVGDCDGASLCLGEPGRCT